MTQADNAHTRADPIFAAIYAHQLTAKVVDAFVAHRAAELG